MDNFIEALLSGKTDKSPDEYDWFAPLLGDWDCDYYDEPTAGRKRHVKGDKLVGKVLSEKDAYWIFSDITADSFHWENVRLPENGEKRLVCEIFGKRIG